MAIVLPKEYLERRDYLFYTANELELLSKLEKSAVGKKSHDEVMNNLRKTLGLTEK